MRRYECRRLTVEEQDALAVRAKAGDLEARNRLVESVMPMIAGRVTKYSGRDEDREDYVQEAAIKVMESLDRYEPNRGAFVSFVAPWAEGGRHLWMHKQGWQRAYRGDGLLFQSMDAKLTPEGKGTVADVIPAEFVDVVERESTQQAVRGALEQIEMTPQERTIIGMILDLGVDSGFQYQCAKKLKVSRQRIGQIWLGTPKGRAGLQKRLRRALRPLVEAA